MKTLSDHIATVHAQPHHVRKQVVMGVSASITAVIALVWFVGSLLSGAFAIHGSSFADAVHAVAPVATTSASGPSGLAGAAGAFSSDANAPAHIDIVDTTPAPQSKQQTQPAILPF